MQKWEYLQIKGSRSWEKVKGGGLFGYAYFESSPYRYTIIINNELREIPNILQCIDNPGNQGWELISTLPTSSYLGVPSEKCPDFAGFTSEVFFYFKRPKE